jgi:hypothetical protein
MKAAGAQHRGDRARYGLVGIAQCADEVVRRLDDRRIADAIERLGRGEPHLRRIVTQQHAE